MADWCFTMLSDNFKSGRGKKKGRENDIELLLTAIHLLTFFHFAMVKKKIN